jgi:hypothetical protein
LIITKIGLRNQFKDIFFTAKQKQVILLEQDLVEICTLQTKYLQKKYPITQPENGLVVLGRKLYLKTNSPPLKVLRCWKIGGPKKRW